MTCREFVRRLSEMSRPDSLQKAHARSCPACAALLDEGPAVSPTAGLVARITEHMDLTPVRPLAGDKALTLRLLAVLGAAVVGGVAVVGIHSHRGADEVTWLLLYGCLVVASSALGVCLPRRVVPGSAFSGAHWVSFVALALFAAGVSARFGRMDLADPIRVGAGCLTVGTLWGVAAAAGVWVVLRRGVWLGAGTGGLAGLAAAMSGLAGLTLHCPILDVSHVLLWHGAAVVLLTFAGAGLMNLRNFPGR